MILCGGFENIISKVLHSEGGYENNPNDRGSPTNHGISWPVWKENAVKYLNELPTLDNLINLTEDQAKIIYKGRYWDNIRVDQIKDGDIRYLLVDFYVNAGGNAITVLKRTLNQLGANLSVNMFLGSETIAAINQADPVLLYNTFLSNRQNYYNYLCTSPNIKYADRVKNNANIDGWTNRVNSFYKKTPTNKYNVNCK